MQTSFVGWILLTASAASAASVTIGEPTAYIYQTNAGASPTGTVTASVTGQVVGNSSLTATACFDGYCPGQGVPGAGPNFLVNDPLTLKLTDFSYSCTFAAGSSCNTIVAGFFSWVDVDLANATVPVTLSIDGFASNSVGIGLSMEIETCDLSGNDCSTISSGLVSPTFTDTAFAGTFNLGNFTLKGLSNAEIDIVLGNVPLGESVIMPGSLTVTLGTPVVNAVPEPATTATLIAGLCAMGLAARRIRVAG